MIYYAHISEAEDAIMAAGYQRNGARAVWINSAGKTVKVERDTFGRFFVKWP